MRIFMLYPIYTVVYHNIFVQPIVPSLLLILLQVPRTSTLPILYVVHNLFTNQDMPSKVVSLNPNHNLPAQRPSLSNGTS